MTKCSAHTKLFGSGRHFKILMLFFRTPWSPCTAKKKSLFHHCGLLENPYSSLGLLHFVLECNIEASNPGFSHTLRATYQWHFEQVMTQLQSTFLRFWSSNIIMTFPGGAMHTIKNELMFVTLITAQWCIKTETTSCCLFVHPTLRRISHHSSLFQL